MAQKGLSMRKIRDVLRLKYGLGRSHREIGTILRICHSTVGSYVRRAREAGLSWPLPGELDDRSLEAALVSAHAAVAGSAPGAAQGRDASTPVAGVPGVARAPRCGAAPGVPGGRAGVRGLRGPDG